MVGRGIGTKEEWADTLNRKANIAIKVFQFDAFEKTGISHAQINKVCNGKAKTAGAINGIRTVWEKITKEEYEQLKS